MVASSETQLPLQQQTNILQVGLSFIQKKRTLLDASLVQRSHACRLMFVTYVCAIEEERSTKKSLKCSVSLVAFLVKTLPKEF